MSEQTQEPLVDTSSVVRPAQHERQKSLEKLYADRPTAHELKERHILLDTDAAPGIQSAQHALEQQRISDSLKKNLEHRPTKEDLVERNILSSTTAAPGIQAQQKELEKHMRADSLNEKLSHRPQPEELVNKGVLKEDPTSPIEGSNESAEKRYEEAIEEEYAKREGGA
ncbi:putative rpel repeat protein [Botrytis fragariae]|uniref:Putative rpel repeat protein n=1 Tax=Botrytis fragariae TaxID=1964551 RepID=A0A8H6AIU3_9HELO|nr:putative rpel repeat protein [Botrytis fragariae]KAF5868085.1 putative rpel repeat protein [Botrytis fragariae]